MDVIAADTANVENMSYMFSKYSSLNGISNIENNIITLKVAKVCNRDDMHTDCTKDFQNMIKVEEATGLSL